MLKIDFLAIWDPEKLSNFFFETTFLPNFGTVITKITIQIHLYANPGAEI